MASEDVELDLSNVSVSFVSVATFVDWERMSLVPLGQADKQSKVAL
jgi:hypothetical protein